MEEEVKEKVRSHYSAYFTKFGIAPNQIARASLYFIALGTVYTAGLWATCYVFSPTRLLVRTLNWPKVHELYAKVQAKAKADQKQGKAAIALAEALVLKGVLGPVALPFKVWLAVKLVGIGKVSETKEQQ